MLVQAPVLMIMSRPWALRMVSSRVPSHALMRIFSTMKSPGCGSSPLTGAAPQPPRTIALLSTTPSNSGALRVSPGAPGSTTNQTWMTATPRARAAEAKRRTFSTTFCVRACAGEPEAAKAPPSLMTSFCRSWMMSAQRRGSRVKVLARAGAAGLGVHVRLAARPDFGCDAIDGMGGGHEQGAEIGPAPGEIGDLLRRAHFADEIARGRVDPDAAGRGDPHVPALVAFHAVWHAFFERRADAGSEDAPVRERAVGGDVEHADQRLRGVVDIDELFVRRKAQAVRLIEET